MLKWWNRWLTAEKPGQRSGLLIEELEPRVLLSADAAGVFAPDPGSLQQQTPTELLLDDNLEPAPAQGIVQQESRTLELVFVDTNTPDYQAMVDDLTNQSTQSRHFEVILLDNNRDGIWQVSQALQNYSDVNAIHLVSHGSDGAIDLGNTRLDGDSLRVQQDQFLNWASYLAADADILIYGCNLAAGDSGLSLMRGLAEVTGADVAASDDLTGHASLGGDWVLEARVGQVETQVFASRGLLESFRATLAAPDAVDDNLGSSYDDQIDSLDPESYFRLNDPSNISDNATPPNTGAAANGSVSQESGGALSGDGDDSLGFDPTDGDDDYIHIPHSSAYEIDNGTISLWFNSTTINGESLFSKDASGTSEGGHLSIYFTGSGAGAEVEVRLQYNTGAGTDSQFVSSSLPAGYLNDGQWHNVVFTFGAGGMQLYIDGELEDTNAYTGGMRGDGDDVPNQEPIALGASRRSSTSGDPTPSGDYFQGQLDEFAIVDSQLTPEQVQQLYRTATGPYIVDEEGSLNVDAAAGVLANDDDGGESTTVSLVSGPDNASSFLLNPDGSFSYTPSENFSGTDTFVYRASNASGSDTATAYIGVNALADDPAFFDYSHSVSLSASTPGDNHVVSITLAEGVNGFSHANAQGNGEDLRFYDSAGVELDYWIEEWNNGGSSTVWVDVAQSGTSTIKLLYGNATAAAQSDGEATFDFFDDFSDGSAGSLPDGWSLGTEAQDGTTPALVDDGGNLVLSDGQTGVSGDAVYHGGEWSDGVVRQDFRVISANDPIEDATLVFRYQDENNGLAVGVHDKDNAKFWYNTTAAGDWQEFENIDISGLGLNLDDGNWHSQEVRFFGDTIELYIDDTFIGSVDLGTDPDIAGADLPLPTSGTAGFWSQDNNAEAYRDNHMVRPYSSVTGEITGTVGAISDSTGLNIDDDASNTDPVGSVHAVDPDGDTLAYSITAGNTGTWAGGAFAIDGNGLITVNNSAALDAATTPSFTLTIEVDDGTGGTDTATVNITVNDATAPAPPTITGITDDTAAADNITADNQLVFSGTAEANSTVEVFLDGASLGTTSADGAGDWNFDHTGTTLSNGGYTVTAEATDGAGNTSASSAGLAFTVDATAPSAPVVTTITDDTGAADNITADNQLVFSGTAEANSSVEVFLDGASLGTTSADGAGDWSFDHTGATLVDGSYTVTAEATDTAGNTSATSAGVAFTVDTVDPSAPTVTGITDDTAAADNITSDNQLVFSGSAEANSSVEVFLDGASLGTTSADGAGDWSFDHTGTTLSNGSYTITAEATDGAGNTSATSTGLVFTVDTTAPAAPTVTAITDDTASADNITSDNQLVFSGSAEANSSVEVFLDGASIGTATANGAGAWSYDHTGITLADGSYTVTAEATDTAGNTGATSAGLAFTVDTAAPSAPAVTTITNDTGAADNITSDNQLVFSGTAEANSSVEVFLDGASIGTTAADGAGDWSFDHTGTTLADGSYTLTAEATDTAGNTSATSAGLAFTVDTAGPAAVGTAISVDTAVADNVTADNQLVFSGTAEANNSVEVFLDGASIGTTTADGAGDWSFDHTGTTLTDGSYTLTARATDTATGQAGATSAGLAFTVDTTAPSAPAVTGISIDTAAADNITADNQLVFSGTAEANSSVEVFLDGASIGTTAADGAGDWSFDHTGTTLADGGYTVTAEATDAAGNTGATSAGLAFTVDTMAPSAPAVTGITDDTGAADNITVDNQLVFSGSAAANSSVEVFLDGASIGTTTADGAGDWSFDHTGTSLADGSYTITAEATDAAGNTGATSAGLAFTVDTTAPSAPAVTGITDDTGAADNITADNQLVFSGTAEANSSVEVFLDGASIGTTTADGAGGWNFDHTGTTLADGSYTVTAEATDTAGNSSATSGGLVITVATGGPAANVTAFSDDTGLPDAITADNQLVFSGTAGAGNSVEVFLDGASIGTTIANGAGDWSFDHSGTTLADGAYSLTAQATNTSTGQTGPVSGSIAFTIDATGPAASVSRISVDTGAADNVTSDNQLVFRGTAEADSSVALFLDDGSGFASLGTTTADGAGNWSFDHTGTTLSDGTYTLLASATDPATGQSGPSSGAFTFTVDTSNSPPSGAVNIDNTSPTQGDTLTVSNTLSDADGLSGAVNYQWLRDGVAIAGAQGNSYTPGQGDVGSTLSVLASYTDDLGTAESATSAATGAVANLDEPGTGSVAIDNMAPVEGDVLRASNNLSDPDGLSGTIAYQWQRDGVEIPGQNGTIYITTASDIGAVISVVASYIDDFGGEGSFASVATAPVASLNSEPTGSVVIAGNAVEDATLTASSAITDADGVGDISYQWQRDGENLPGATGASYILGQEDVGARISVVASYVDGGGTPESLGSDPTALIENRNDEPEGSLMEPGVAPTPGVVLNAGDAITDEDGIASEISYQWMRDGEPIPGAEGETYEVQETDTGAVITVEATYIDRFGTQENFMSDGVLVAATSGGSGPGSGPGSGSGDTPGGNPVDAPAPGSFGDETEAGGGVNLPNEDPSADGGGTVVDSPTESPAPFVPPPVESGSGFESSGGGTPILNLGDDLDIGQRSGTGGSVINLAGGDDAAGSDPTETEVILADAALEDELVDSLLELIQGDDSEEELGLGAGSASALVEEEEQLEEESSDAIAAVLTNHAMWDAIDRMHDQMENGNQSQLTREELVVQLVSTSSVGIFAALTMYALRGGALMASWLSTVPLWGTLDPLPVLGAKKDKREDVTAEEAEDENRARDPDSLFGSQGAES